MVTVAVVVVGDGAVSQSPVSNALWGHFHGNCSYGPGSVRWENNSFRLPCHEICQSQSMMAPDPNPELEERLDYLSINYRLWFVCQGAAHCRIDTQSTICTLWLISSHSHFFNGGEWGRHWTRTSSHESSLPQLDMYLESPFTCAKQMKSKLPTPILRLLGSPPQFSYLVSHPCANRDAPAQHPLTKHLWQLPLLAC